MPGAYPIRDSSITTTARASPGEVEAERGHPRVPGEIAARVDLVLGSHARELGLSVAPVAA
jgi:hypothetical protein